MGVRRWRLTITQAGLAAPVADTVVEASHWLGALEAAQRALGERTGVPAGASCAVAPDEHVVIHDPRARRRYHLGPVPGGLGEAPPGGTGDRPAPAASPAGRPAPPGPGLPAQTARRAAARTMAYDVGAVLPPPAPPAAGKRTIAYNVKDLPLPPPPVPVGAPPAPPPAAAVPPPPPRDPSPRAPSPPDDRGAVREPARGTVLSRRDASPTAESPLHYRERTYFVPGGTAEREAVALLRVRLAEIQRDLAALPPGKYVNLAAFDHAWKDTPTRPPIATLQWMDWRGAPEIAYPLRDGT